MAGYFLDTSALAKLYHEEVGSQYVERLLASPEQNVIVSRLSLVEMESVLAIKVRTGELDAEAGIGPAPAACGPGAGAVEGWSADR